MTTRSQTYTAIGMLALILLAAFLIAVGNDAAMFCAIILMMVITLLTMSFFTSLTSSIWVKRVIVIAGSVDLIFFAAFAVDILGVIPQPIFLIWSC